MIEYVKTTQIYQSIFIVFCIVVALVLKHYLKDKDEKTKRIPLYVISIFLFVLEIFKLIRNFCGYDNRYFFAILRGMKHQFEAYAFPFHFCSFFIFFGLFQFLFRNNKKLSLFFDNMTYLWSTLITIFMIFYPAMIYGPEIQTLLEDGELVHAVVFHSSVMLYWAIALSLKTYDYKFKTLYQAPLCMLIYALFAIPAAHIFKENYCSLYSCEGWDFLIPVFEKGYFAYDGLLVLVGMILTTVIYSMIILIEKCRLFAKNNNWYIFSYIAYAVLLLVLLLVSHLTGYEQLRPLYSVYVVGLLIVCLLPSIVKGQIMHFVKK